MHDGLDGTPYRDRSRPRAPPQRPYDPMKGAPDSYGTGVPTMPSSSPTAPDVRYVSPTRMVHSVENSPPVKSPVPSAAWQPSASTPPHPSAVGPPHPSHQAATPVTARLERRLDSVQQEMHAALRGIEQQMNSLANLLDQRASDKAAIGAAVQQALSQGAGMGDGLAALRDELQREGQDDMAPATGPHAPICRAIRNALHRAMARQLAEWADMWEERGVSAVHRAACDAKNEWTGELRELRRELNNLAHSDSQIPPRLGSLENKIMSLDEKVVGLESLATKTHLQVTDVDRRILQQTDDLQGALNGMSDQYNMKLQGIEHRLAALEQGPGDRYHEEVWEHLKSTSEAMESGLKGVEEDTAHQLDSFRADLDHALEMGEELIPIHGNIEALNERMRILEHHFRIMQDDGQHRGLAEEEDLARIREEMRRLQTDCQRDINEAAARMQRQLSQDSTRRRGVLDRYEERLASLEAKEAEDGRVLRGLIDTLRDELERQMAEADQTYRRRLDTTDRQLRDIRRQMDDVDQRMREALEGQAAVFRQLHENQGPTEEDFNRWFNNRLNQDFVQKVINEATALARRQNERLAALEARPPPISFGEGSQGGDRALREEVAQLRRLISSVMSDLQSLESIKDDVATIRMQVADEAERIDRKADRELVQRIQEEVTKRALDAAKKQILGKVEARMDELEDNTAGLRDISGRMEDLEERMRAAPTTRSTKGEGVDRRTLDKLLEERTAPIAQQLEQTKDVLHELEDRLEVRVNAVERGVEKLQDELHKVSPKDLKRQLQDMGDEFKRMREELQKAINDSEDRHKYFSTEFERMQRDLEQNSANDAAKAEEIKEEFDRMRAVLAENFAEDEQRTAQMRDLQKELETKNQQAVSEIRKVYAEATDQLYDITQDTSQWRDRVATVERNYMELKGFTEQLVRAQDAPIEELTKRVIEVEKQLAAESQKVRRQLELANKEAGLRSGETSPLGSPRTASTQESFR